MVLKIKSVSFSSLEGLKLSVEETSFILDHALLHSPCKCDKMPGADVSACIPKVYENFSNYWFM